MSPLDPSFALHPQLRKDTLGLGRLGLSRLLLMNESRYPWLILVPELPGLMEISDLRIADQHRLIEESSRLSLHLQRCYPGSKLNIAAIGNLVPQLHLHHVVRFKEDPAWPAPVWGREEAIPYSEEAEAEMLWRLKIETLPGWAPFEIA